MFGRALAQGCGQVAKIHDKTPAGPKGPRGFFVALPRNRKQFLALAGRLDRVFLDRLEILGHRSEPAEPGHGHEGPDQKHGGDKHFPSAHEASSEVHCKPRLRLPSEA